VDAAGNLVRALTFSSEETLLGVSTRDLDLLLQMTAMPRAVRDKNVVTSVQLSRIVRPVDAAGSLVRALTFSSEETLLGVSTRDLDPVLLLQVVVIPSIGLPLTLASQMNSTPRCTTST